MEATILFGSALTIAGIHALLAREAQTAPESPSPAAGVSAECSPGMAAGPRAGRFDSDSADKAAGETADECPGRNDCRTRRVAALVERLTSRTGTGYTLALTGLLILTAALSRPSAWWGPSLLDGPAATVVYWPGTLAVLAGAVAVAFGRSDRTSCQGMVLTGTGGALLFALAGDLVAGGALIAAATAAAWVVWFRVRSATGLLPEGRTGTAFSEPLLLSVSLVGFLVLTGVTLHRSATGESRRAGTYETGDRALPRPAVARGLRPEISTAGSTSGQSSDRAENTGSRREAAGGTSPAGGAGSVEVRRGASAWSVAVTYGLLLLVMAAGLWRQWHVGRLRSAAESSVQHWTLAGTGASVAGPMPPAHSASEPVASGLPVSESVVSERAASEQSAAEPPPASSGDSQ